MNKATAAVLGIDIGGTNTKLGLVHAAGTIDEAKKIPTEARGTDAAPFFARLYEVTDRLVTIAGSNLIGIGISAHGEVDRERRRPIIAGNTPALRNVDVRGAIEQRYSLPTVMNNDLTAHALGEYVFGCGNGIERFMCLAMGTGLGAALIVDGKPLIIDGGNSGNTGLIILDPNAPRDSNGIRGSAEGLCGVPGIERLARERYGRDIPAHEVIAAARNGDDETAAAIMAQIGTWLGQTLASLSVIFYPHRIALTGGTASAGAVLLDACRETFDDLVGDFFRDLAVNTGGSFRDVEIVLGKGGEDTGMLGAAVEIFQQRGLL
ncbi:MAG: ROK family protein [Burkholderiales bacterium]|nr:ROK family protein [Anaerolineae bacterium]